MKKDAPTKEAPEKVGTVKVLVTVWFDRSGLPGPQLRNYELEIPSNKALTTGEAILQLQEKKVIGFTLVGPILVGPAFPRKKAEDPSTELPDNPES